MDLPWGYWQVPGAEDSHPSTAFTPPQGLYQFTAMLFGLCGAPSHFLMIKWSASLESCAAAYLDDLFIYSNSWEENWGHFMAVLERLKGTSVTLKPCKSHFAVWLNVSFVACCWQRWSKFWGDHSRGSRAFLHTLDKEGHSLLPMSGGHYCRFILDFATWLLPSLIWHVRRGLYRSSGRMNVMWPSIN